MKVLSYPELKSEKGIRYSPQWIRKLVKAGSFPAPINLGEATVGFVETEVDAWLKAKIAARDSDAASMARRKGKGT
jgi:prophage regulatory protein